MFYRSGGVAADLGRGHHRAPGRWSNSMKLPFQTIAALALLVAGTSNVEAQSSPPVRVRGTVLSIEATELAVKSRAGEDVRIRLAENWSAGAVVPAKLTDITPGTFVGIASLPQPGGASRAIEVLIFPK